MAKRRSKGGGSVYKRADTGVYCFQWYTPAGARKVKSLRTKSRQEALTKALEFEKAVNAGDKIEVLHQAAKARGVMRERQLPLSEVWRVFTATRPTSSPGTLENHRRNLARFVAWAGIRLQSFTQIDEDTAREYAAELWQSGISAATYNYHRASLMMITNALARQYGIDPNPWESVDRQAGEQQTRRTVTAEQINQLIEGLSGDAELQTLVMLGCYAGMRLKDAALLKWQDIDLSRRLITYRPYKTRRRNKAAIVPITGDLFDALHRLASGGDYVLPRLAASYTHGYDGFKKSLTRLIATVAPSGTSKGEMQHLQARQAAGFHALRHYFCTTCANKGIPAAQLEVMTGDQARTLERHYIHGKIDFNAVSVALGAIERPHTQPASKPHTQPATQTDRERLKELADELPIENIQMILAALNGKKP